jgi:hypothetical protein
VGGDVTGRRGLSHRLLAAGAGESGDGATARGGDRTAVVMVGYVTAPHGGRVTTGLRVTRHALGRPYKNHDNILLIKI